MTHKRLKGFTLPYIPQSNAQQHTTLLCQQAQYSYLNSTSLYHFTLSPTHKISCSRENDVYYDGETFLQEAKRCRNTYNNYKNNVD